MSKSLLLLFKKERCEWFAFLLSKIERFNRKNLYFSYVFKSFSLLFPFLCPRANGYCRSLVCRLFLKSNGSDSLSSLFTKERPWAIHSHSFLQKSNGSDSLVSKNESLFRSFAHRKQLIWSKNQRANSQPWFVLIFFLIFSLKNWIFRNTMTFAYCLR